MGKVMGITQKNNPQIYKHNGLSPICGQVDELVTCMSIISLVHDVLLEYRSTQLCMVILNIFVLQICISLTPNETNTRLCMHSRAKCYMLLYCVLVKLMSYLKVRPSCPLSFLEKPVDYIIRLHFPKTYQYSDSFLGYGKMPNSKKLHAATYVYINCVYITCDYLSKTYPSLHITTFNNHQHTVK